MDNKVILKDLSRQIVMTGVYYKDNHPGGISAVVQYWSKYIEGLQYYPTFKEGNRLTKIFLFFISIVRLFYKLKYDKNVRIVHIHTAAGTDFTRTAIVADLAKRYGKKVIIHLHASSFKNYYLDSSDKRKKWIRNILNMADILIALSDSWKNYYMSLGVPGEKIEILHNITEYPIKKNVEKQENKVRLLFLGEIGERKGVFDLLKVIADHKEELKDKIELRIGGNKQEEKIRSVIKDGELESFVIFLGFVAGEKKIDLLNWANVFILPSYNEGLPISILEAMSYEMPIISTPVGGIQEVVCKDNGILVTPGNHSQIYNAIKYYIDNFQMISKHGKNSYQKVKTYYPDYVITHLREIYVRLLAS